MGAMARPRADESRDTRAALLDAALDAFAEAGFEGASVRDIARRAGVTDAALYHWFESKEALLVAVVDATARSRVAVVDEAFAEQGERPLSELLATMLARVGADPSTRRSLKLLRALMTTSPQQLATLLPLVLERVGPLMARTMGRFRALQRSGRVRSDLSLEVLISHLIGPPTLVWLAQSKGVPLPFDAARFARDHARFMASAMAPAKPPPARASSKKGTKR